jgi:glycosyltransferase involved in cell wall biosynthesis
MPDTVEVMHTHAVDRLKKFLKGRPLYYDTVWISRMHNLARIRPILSELMANGVLRARIVLDTEAVTPHREALHARLTGETYDLDAGMRAFAADANICQAVVAVTPVESAILQDHGVTGVSLIGHMIRQQPTARPFAERAGILFVGAIHQHDSPNLDSLIWFVDQVLPLIETELRWQTRLTIAGYVAPGIDLQRFAHHPRVTLHGVVSNLEPLYGSHRVFVAPTRFAAGAPYKVLEAASYGLPVIATDLLRGQLNWTDRQDILAAPADDPVSFAACVLALYRDADLWNAIRQGALQRLQDENAPEGFTQSVAATLGLHGA